MKSWFWILWWKYPLPFLHFCLFPPFLVIMHSFPPLFLPRYYIILPRFPNKIKTTSPWKVFFLSLLCLSAWNPGLFWNLRVNFSLYEVFKKILAAAAAAAAAGSRWYNRPGQDSGDHPPHTHSETSLSSQPRPPFQPSVPTPWETQSLCIDVRTGPFSGSPSSSPRTFPSGPKIQNLMVGLRPFGLSTGSPLLTYSFSFFSSFCFLVYAVFFLHLFQYTVTFNNRHLKCFYIKCIRLP